MTRLRLTRSSLRLNSDFDELSGVSTSQAPVPALHVILARPTASPSPLADSSDKTDLRAQLVEYIAASLGGDKTAAEWVLLALVARMYVSYRFSSSGPY